MAHDIGVQGLAMSSKC